LRSLAMQFGWLTAKLDQMEFCLGYFRRVGIDDAEILRAYSVIDAQTTIEGESLGKNDVWIAATAAVTGATLLTTDRDFDRLTPRFIVREWIDPDR
jgi:tRNA(fMet)-specific endonuclease VapC